jgi:hypothetical protein
MITANSTQFVGPELPTSVLYAVICEAREPVRAIERVVYTLVPADTGSGNGASA